MSKTTRHGRPDADSKSRNLEAADPEGIPSTLDPRLDSEATEDIERELGDVSRERHEPDDDELPEDEIFDEVRRAAEELPADTPVDRADQTDKRMENPPSGSDL
ncbi:hypothetical protein SAMN04488595_11043 [Ralstonia sp. 25mfcol4.1]|uniref:hypothetical protein n=1 Tax=Burkholderiaceae TaxID=119060 RepID=UPI00087F0188|nr:hypothetical protein [Ralstonia sp. 25mfcol4.1]SDP49243.1 hypothetical protein SAMN04488595_11043 [Ralstonia sp. 25mfcol4.1]